MTLSSEIAEILLRIEAIQFRPDQPVTFKSGIKSPVYIDNRTLPYHPEAWHTLINGFAALIKSLSLQVDVLAGIETAGIPHSAALGFLTGIPSVFVRKEAKEHGKKKRVEGGDVTGKRVLLIEDLITTGGSSLSGVEALRNEGAVVTDCMAIISYGFEDAVHNFEQAGVRLHTLTDFASVWATAKASGQISPDVIAEVEAWHQSPREWRVS